MKGAYVVNVYMSSCTICTNKNTTFIKIKNMECCKLICTVHLRCLLVRCIIIPYYVCIIQFVEFFLY